MRRYFGFSERLGLAECTCSSSRTVGAATKIPIIIKITMTRKLLLWEICDAIPLFQVIFYAGNYRNACWPHEGTTGTSLHIVDFKDLNFFLILRLWAEPTRAWTIRVSTPSPHLRIHLVYFDGKEKDWLSTRFLSMAPTIGLWSVCATTVCVCASLCLCFLLLFLCVVVRHGGSMSF